MLDHFVVDFVVSLQPSGRSPGALRRSTGRKPDLQPVRAIRSIIVSSSLSLVRALPRSVRGYVSQYEHPYLLYIPGNAARLGLPLVAGE